MEEAKNLGMKKLETIPSLIRSIDANEVVGFDDDLMKHCVLDVESMVCTLQHINLQTKDMPLSLICYYTTFDQFLSGFKR